MSTATSSEGADPQPLSRIETKRRKKMREILFATADLLNERGYHALSMDDVAERVDLTKATLYHYYEGKDDLVAACITTTGTEVNQRLEALAVEHADASSAEKLRLLLLDRLEVLVFDYPGVARLFSQPHEWPTELYAQVRELRHTHEGIFRQIVQQGVASGEFRADLNVDLVLHCVYGATNYVPTWLRGRSRAAVRRQFVELIDHLMRMFVGNPTPASR